MQDASLKKSSGDAPSQEGAPRCEDFSIFKTVKPFDASSASLVLQAALERRAGKAPGLYFAFRFEGEVASLDLPYLLPTDSRKQKDELWKATCFEFFIGEPGQDAYLEFNLAPNGDFASYEFQNYREGMTPVLLATPPLVSVERTATGYSLSGMISESSNSLIAALLRSSKLQASLTTVVKYQSSKTPNTYRALTHAGEKPDFHLRQSFTLDLI